MPEQTLGEVALHVQTERGERAYVKLPNEVALNRNLGAAGLGLLTYRATFVGEYALHRTHLSKRFGIGDLRFDTAIKQSIRQGYLKRWRANDGNRRHARMIERVLLPDIKSGYVFIRRSLFDAHSIETIAAFVFVAARPYGRHVYIREVAGRFDWAEQTARKHLNEVIEAGMVEREAMRQDTGRLNGYVYRVHEQFALAAPEVSSTDPHFGAASWIERFADARSDFVKAWEDALVDSTAQADAAEFIDDQTLKNELVKACRGRISPSLLQPSGLDGARILIAAFSNKTGWSIEESFHIIIDVLGRHVGGKTERHVISWSYLGLTLYGISSPGG